MKMPAVYGNGSGGLRYWFCREGASEECGVLLATTADGQFLTSDKRLELASKGRQELGGYARLGCFFRIE